MAYLPVLREGASLAHGHASLPMPRVMLSGWTSVAWRPSRLDRSTPCAQVDIGRYLRTTEPAGPGQQFQSFQVQQTVVHPRFTTNTTRVSRWTSAMAAL